MGFRVQGVRFIVQGVRQFTVCVSGCGITGTPSAKAV